MHLIGQSSGERPWGIAGLRKRFPATKRLSRAGGDRTGWYAPWLLTAIGGVLHAGGVRIALSRTMG